MKMDKSKLSQGAAAEVRETIRKLVLVFCAIAAALLVGSLFIMALGVNPFSAYYQLLIRPFISLKSFGEVIAKATPLIIVAVGVAFAAKGGNNNLGGEGQLYVGALGMVLVGTSPWGMAMGGWAVPAGLLASMLFGGVWGGIAGYFKAYFRSSELITTLMLNYIAIELTAYLVHGPLMEPGGVNPQSAAIPKDMRFFKFIPGSRAHIGILIAIACVVLYAVVLKHTKIGYNLRTVGISRRAAEYSGVNPPRYLFLSMVTAGVFAGFAGGVGLCGVQYRFQEGMFSGIGITGMVVALLGLLSPIGIVVAAFLMSGLSAGAEIMQVASGVPVTLVDILQGMIVLFVLLSFSIKPRKKKADGTVKQSTLPPGEKEAA